MRKLLWVSAAIMGLAALPQPASAAVITGELDFGSNVGVRVTPTTIDFLATPGGDIGVPGTAIVNSTSTLQNGGVAVPGLSGSTVLEKDLSVAAQPPGPVGFPGGPLSFFETLNADPTINFTLSNLVRCGDTPLGIIAGAIFCPLGLNSAFLFNPVSSTDTTVTINLIGTVFDTDTPTLISNFVGHIDAPFPGQTILQLLTAFETAGFIDTSFSGAKVSTFAPVPEPMTLLTFGAGAILAVRKRRKAAKA